MAKFKPFVKSITRPAARAQQNQRNRRHLRDFALGGVLGAVPRGHVRDLVRHHARQFRFGIGAQDQSAIHVEKSARQRERIHHIGIDHLDREGNLRVRIAHQVLPHAVHVFGHDRIVDQLRRALHFLRQALAQRDLALE